MLKSISIKNFRKHTNSAFNFSDGLHVMRGSNEAGKSTMLEAIAYALFGVKALRSPLADTVTWGEAESTLKVVLELSIDGVDYTISRGKSGAEVNYDGGRVTGQTESTTFIASKLKVDAQSASKLMLSTQMDIRGALEAGPKATTELIERLAEFDQIDNLIELMQEKLTLGSAAVATAALEQAVARLASVADLQEPDLVGLQARVDGHQSSVTLAEAEVTNARAADRAAQTANVEGQGVARDHTRLKAKLEQIQANLDRNLAERINLGENALAKVENADERIQRALGYKADLVADRQRRGAFEAVKPFLGIGGVERYAGGQEAWQEALNAAQAGVDAARERLRKGDVMYADLKAKLNNDSCSFCGKDFSDLPEIQAKNVETQATMEAVSVNLASYQADLEKHQALITTLKALQTAARPTLDIAYKYAQYLGVDTSQYPAILSWKGDEPTDSEGDQPDYDGEIARIRAGVKAFADWERAVHANSDEDMRLRREKQENLEALDAIIVPDLEALALADRTARADLNAAQQTLDDVRRSLELAKSDLRNQTRDWERAVQTREDSAAAVETAQSNLKNLEFNNTLLKCVRAARPVIANRLWNLVLASVSTYFSEMRGTRSAVTKTSEGFLVDGHPVATLSGSTLDILGLAIRVALVRTFLPAAPFLVLDEPCASMDVARTESLLGFLVAVGFKQILLVTHEDVSESVADHIIAIGE